MVNLLNSTNVKRVIKYRMRSLDKRKAKLPSTKHIKY